jgi:hypothetical protein
MSRRCDLRFRRSGIPRLNELPYHRWYLKAWTISRSPALRLMTHEGQSRRGSPRLLCDGEAAGGRGAGAVGQYDPRDIAVEKLQQTLKQQGAFIGRDQPVPEGL